MFWLMLHTIMAVVIWNDRRNEDEMRRSKENQW